MQSRVLLRATAGRTGLMRVVFLFWAVVMCQGVAVGTGTVKARLRHSLFRSMVERVGGDGSRRVFGGRAAELSAYPPACVLLDRKWSVRCSAAVVAPHWALTAAHCVAPQVAYVKYNARHPTRDHGQLATVYYLYRHPDFKVVEEDEGLGPDVTTLHNDVGLVRTISAMILDKPPALNPLQSMKLYNPNALKRATVQVLGFGSTEQLKQGEELFEVKLQLVPCDRKTWYHCMCAVSASVNNSSPASNVSLAAGGVCTGDSGGPVLYRGAQVGVTSMGPIECSLSSASVPEGATSVFTSLYQYSDLINDTIFGTDSTSRMRMIASGCRPCLRTRVTTLTALALLAPMLLQLVLIV